METSSLTKKYYTIADVSELLNLPASTLRFWEKEFSQLRVHRSGTRRRMYTPKDVELLDLIRFLVKERGLKIDAARDYIRNNRADLDCRHAVVRRLQAIRYSQHWTNAIRIRSKSILHNFFQCL